MNSVLHIRNTDDAPQMYIVIILVALLIVLLCLVLPVLAGWPQWPILLPPPKKTSRMSISSWDVFDTCVARFGYEPQSVFEMIAVSTKQPDFVQRRRQCRGASLHEVYGELAREYKWDARQRRAHMQMELDMEARSLFPIQSVVDQIQDGDILVSDMYLSESQLRWLLHVAGFPLEKIDKLWVSPGGKMQQGRIWPEITRHLHPCTVAVHSGDNMQADVQIPQTHFHIPTRHIALSQWSKNESQLLASVCACHRVMVNGMRVIRLSEPRLVSENQIHHQLWSLQSECNFPILFLLSHWLEQLRRQLGRQRILFVTRDCCLWRLVFTALFPTTSTRTMYSSRKCLAARSSDYLCYLRDEIRYQPDADIVVDLRGTGHSLHTFFSRWPETNVRPFRPCIAIPFLSADKARKLDYRDRVHCLATLPESFLVIESSNHDVEGSVVDVINRGQPVRRAYDGNLENTQIMHRALKSVLPILARFTHDIIPTFGTPEIDLLKSNILPRWYKQLPFLEHCIGIDVN